MSLQRWASKRDQNEQIICELLEAQGFCIQKISATGAPDLIVSQRRSATNPRLWLVEIKRPGKGFTKAQVAWRAKWGGAEPITLRTVEDAQHFCLLAMETGA